MVMDPEELRAQLLKVVEQTMQPTHLALWLVQRERRPEGQRHHMDSLDIQPPNPSRAEYSDDAAIDRTFPQISWTVPALKLASLPHSPSRDVYCPYAFRLHICIDRAAEHPDTTT